MSCDILTTMDCHWLNSQFKLNPDKSKAGLAEAIGLEPPAVSKILKGTRQIKAHEYVIMRRYFGLPVDGEKSLRNSESFVISPLHPHGELNDNSDKEQISDWLIPANVLAKRTKAPPEQVKIFEIQENTMEPEFRHGEHVVVDISDTEPSPPGVFIVSDGFGYLIRQCEYLPNSSPPEIKVTATNKSFHPHTLKEEEFKIIGRVIAKLQWI